jgi:Zn-dependent metalloprotease
VRLNPDNGTIRYLKVKNPSKKFFGIQPKSENPEDIAISFVEFYKTLFRLQQPHSELKCVAAQTDELGLRHIHFRQIYQEIPVWAKEINVHLDRNNSVYLVEGQYIPTPHYVLTQPAFSASKAVELVFDEIGVKADREPQDIAELVIYAKEFKKALLAYKVQAPGRMVFVDAAKGVIIEHISTRLTNSDKFVPEAPSLR